MAIRGITFDFWDTIVDDDTDEPKRAAQGLQSKADARVSTFVDEVLAHHPGVGRAGAEAALGFHNEVVVANGQTYAACYNYTDRSLWFSQVN